MRYLVIHNFYTVAVKNLSWWVVPLFALSQCAGVPVHAQSAVTNVQTMEGGMLLPTAAPMTATKPVTSSDLRTVLQMQKTRPQETAPPVRLSLPAAPERHLSTQERSELREQLRHQERHPRDVSSH